MYKYDDFLTSPRAAYIILIKARGDGPEATSPPLISIIRGAIWEIVVLRKCRVAAFYAIVVGPFVITGKCQAGIRSLVSESVPTVGCFVFRAGYQQNMLSALTRRSPASNATARSPKAAKRFRQEGQLKAGRAQNRTLWQGKLHFH